MANPPTTLPAALQSPDLGAAYQNVFDLLGTAYWEASDIVSKDQIFSARQEVADIIDALDAQDLAVNTAAFTALVPKLTAANKALTDIQTNVNKITANISTAGSIVAAITKVLSLLPK